MAGHTVGTNKYNIAYENFWKQEWSLMQTEVCGSNIIQKCDGKETFDMTKKYNGQ